MKKKSKQQKSGITKITMNQLRKMATTKKLKYIFQTYIENEKIPSVKAAWIEYFIDKKKNSSK